MITPQCYDQPSLSRRLCAEVLPRLKEPAPPLCPVHEQALDTACDSYWAGAAGLTYAEDLDELLLAIESLCRDKRPCWGWGGTRLGQAPRLCPACLVLSDALVDRQDLTFGESVRRHDALVEACYANPECRRRAEVSA